MILCICGSSRHVEASESKAAVEAYRRNANAVTAIAAAESLRDAGNVGQAANLAEQCLAYADQRGAHGRALRLLHALKWPLRDAGFGMVELRVDPAHASVAVDEQTFGPRRGRYRCWFSSGSHQLLVVLSGFTSVERVITAQVGETRQYQATLKDIRPAMLVIDVAPVTAEIWIDGAYAGLSTKRSFAITRGRRLLEARADGHTSYTDALDLAPNQTLEIQITLERTGAIRRARSTASDVPRQLTPLELANRGERHRVGQRPLERLRQRGITPIGSGDSTDAKPVAPSETADGEPPPPRESPPVDDDGGRDSGDAPQDFGGNGDPGAAIDSDVSSADSADSAAGEGVSGLLKGVIWSGIGVVLIGGGVGTAIYGAGTTETANDLRVGNKGYVDYYQQGATLAYAGYGVAGIGAIAAGVGGFYLFGSDGLRRGGKGGVLISAGALAAATGGYLVLRSTQAAAVAEGFAFGDPRYDARIEGAQSTWRAGVVAAGVGGVAAIAGLYMLLSKPGGAVYADGGLRLLPQLAPGQRGAALVLDW